MEDNGTIMDRAVKDAVALNRKIIEAVAELAPRPPGMRKLTEREQLGQYAGLTPQALSNLVRQKGEAEVNRYISRMEALRRKHQPGGGPQWPPG